MHKKQQKILYPLTLLFMQYFPNTKTSAKGAINNVGSFFMELPKHNVQIAPRTDYDIRIQNAKNFPAFFYSLKRLSFFRVKVKKMEGMSVNW